MNRALALLVVALVAILPLSGCLSPQVDEAALFTPAAETWPRVKPEYLRGIERSVADGATTEPVAVNFREHGDRLGLALSARNRTALRLLPWPTMRAYVELGIATRLEAGELGEHTAGSLRERLAQFNQTLEKLRSL